MFLKKINIQKNQKLYGLLLWALVLSGYFLFVFNWAVIDLLKGTPGIGGVNGTGTGWAGAFFTENPSALASRATTYTITAMRGVGAIASGWVIVKFGHRKSVLISLGLLCVGLPAIFTAYLGGTAGYSLFIIGRMIMAIGGTVLIVFIQPILAKFFDTKNKVILLKTSAVAFNFGIALPFAIFAIPGVTAFLTQYWILFACIISSIPIVLLIIYFFFAQDIEIEKASLTYEKETDLKLKSATFKSVGKDKDTWKFIAFYGGFIVLVVVAIFLIPAYYFPSLHKMTFGVSSIVTGWEWKLIPIFFVLGFIPGMFLIAWIANTKYNRRGYFVFITSMVIVFLIAAYLSAAYINSAVPAIIFMFLVGVFLWGLQGPMMHIPHEIKTNSPKRVSIINSYSWGAGYLIYTIVGIIFALIADGLAEVGKANIIPWVIFGMVLLSALTMPIASAFFPKTYDTPVREVFKNHKFFKKFSKKSK